MSVVELLHDMLGHILIICSHQRNLWCYLGTSDAHHESSQCSIEHVLEIQASQIQMRYSS